MFIPLHDSNALEHIKLQYVTLGIIATNVIIWLMTSTPAIMGAEEANVVFFSYGFIPAVVNDLAVLPPEYTNVPEALQYVSYAFFHGDFMHLAGNMLFLWVFGDNVEDAMGHLKYLVFYLLCAAAGAFAHQLVIPNSEAPLIGASGAAAGVVAAYLVLHPKVRVWILAFGRIPLRLSAMWVIGAWIGFQLFNFIFMPESHVSWAAHIGGIIAGAVLVLVMKRRDVALFDQNLQPAAADGSKSRPVTAQGDSKSSEPAAKSGRIWGRSSDNK